MFYLNLSPVSCVTSGSSCTSAQCPLPSTQTRNTSTIRPIAPLFCTDSEQLPAKPPLLIGSFKAQPIWHQLILFKLETSTSPIWSSLSQPNEELAGSTYKSRRPGTTTLRRLLLSISIRTAMELAFPCPTKAVLPMVHPANSQHGFSGCVHCIQIMPTGIALRRDAPDNRFGLWNTHCNLRINNHSYDYQ